MRIWIASDQEIRTCNLAPGHIHLLFPPGSEHRYVRGLPAIEHRLAQLATKSIGIKEIVGANEPSYALSSDKLRSLVEAATARRQDPLRELFEPFPGSPTGEQWTKVMLDVAKAALNSHSGIVFCSSSGL
ncbi:MAG: hypothetical protein AB7O24_25800 [Kofleriaceae bacterium]